MDNENFKISSYIASPIFMVVSLVLCFICAYINANLLSGYLFFMFLLAVASFFWGRFSEKEIAVNIQAESYHVYPGQDMNMQFTLENNKALPLVWLEWVQEYPPNDCLHIPEDFMVCDTTNPSAQEIQEPKLSKSFSFIRWYETIEWTSTFYAEKRGVYLPKNITIHTGDGFGLCVRKKEYTLPSPPVFVIYPKRVPVKTEIFFKNSWSATTGSRGAIEDVTVLKGIREYLPNDSFKRINWRLAARSDELNVNIYETIAPKSVYFLVDTKSFFGVSENNMEFEETLSVVGSLIEELFSLDMKVGLYLPAVLEDVELENNSLNDCLLSLAYADCNNENLEFNRESLLHLQSNQSGNIYYVCYDAGCGTFDTVFEEVGISSYSVISYKEAEEEKSSIDVQVLLLSDLKRI